MDTGPGRTGVFNTDARVKSNLADFRSKGAVSTYPIGRGEYARQVLLATSPGAANRRRLATRAAAVAATSRSTKRKAAGCVAAKSTGQNAVRKDAWTAIASVLRQDDIDADGKMSKITPKVWVETTSPGDSECEHGCGRVLYTTYHTQPTSETRAARWKPRRWPALSDLGSRRPSIRSSSVKRDGAAVAAQYASPVARTALPSATGISAGAATPSVPPPRLYHQLFGQNKQRRR